MLTMDCPDPETLARFATRDASPSEWRAVVRHLSGCALCRRQVALVAEKVPAQLPEDAAVPLRVLPASENSWGEWATGIAAAGLIGLLGLAWALRPRTVEPPPPAAPPRV